MIWRFYRGLGFDGLKVQAFRVQGLRRFGVGLLWMKRRSTTRFGAFRGLAGCFKTEGWRVWAQNHILDWVMLPLR